MMQEFSTGSPSALASSKQKCSFSTCPSKSPVGGLKIWVVGWARRNTPSTILKQQCGFRLGPGKTELAGITGNAPGRVVGTQQAKPRRDRGVIQPFDLLARPAKNR